LLARLLSLPNQARMGARSTRELPRAPPPAPPGTSHLQAGVQHCRNNNFRAAAVEFTIATRLNPASAMGWNHRGLSHRHSSLYTPCRTGHDLRCWSRLCTQLSRTISRSHRIVERGNLTRSVDVEYVFVGNDSTCLRI